MHKTLMHLYIVEHVKWGFQGSSISQLFNKVIKGKYPTCHMLSKQISSLILVGIVGQKGL